MNTHDVKARSVAEVLDLYRQWGREHYDEQISQLDHALQTAALAGESDAPPELVAASLLHDVGHLLELQMARGPGTATTDLRHEARGSKYLGDLFSADVTGPIALHVRAKRYLCAVDPAYHAGLSEGSHRSLARQGGPLELTEVQTFEELRGFEDAVRLREWDDLGKVEGLEVLPMDHYCGLLESLAVRP